MKEAQERYTHYANRGKKDMILNIGNKVLVTTYYYVDSTTAAHPSAKLHNKFMSPYKVIKVMSPVSYMLDLPKNMKIHPVIHVSQLKCYIRNSPYSPNQAKPLPEIIDSKEEYEVEKILDKRTKYRHAEYLVKWKGYGNEDNMWLPYWKLDNSADLVKEFEYTLNKRNGKKKVYFVQEFTGAHSRREEAV